MNAVMQWNRPEQLHAAYQKLQAERPQLRVREAAAELGVSEVQLVAAGGATRLREDWAALLSELPRLGRVMVLTRNEACVHERQGCYENVEVSGGMGLVLGPDIDLRLFLRRWTFGYACTQKLHSGLRKSLQFFDANGTAIQKIYLSDNSMELVFDQLVPRFKAEDQSAQITVAPEALRAQDRPDAQIDVAGLRAAWEALRDTHDFFGLHKRFKVGRLQALRLVGRPLAQQVPAEACKQILDAAAARQEPVMVFVGNPGCIQIHTGEVHRIARKGPWLNVLDEDFNLHLREDLVMQTWVVRKPTEDGVVTALELYDADNELIVQFFGQRKPGQPERRGWREIVAQIETARMVLP